MDKSAKYNNATNQFSQRNITAGSIAAGTSGVSVYVGSNDVYLETNHIAPFPPPSYEQATGVNETTTTTITTNVNHSYPPVEVLPIPPVSTLNRPGTRAVNSPVNHTYPPVEVLPTPPVSTLNRPRTRVMNSNVNHSYPPVEVLPTPPASTLNRPRTHVIVTGESTHVNSNTTYYNTVPRVLITPAQPRYHGSQPQEQRTYIQAPQQPQVILLQEPVFGPDPAFVICPNCHMQKLSRIEYQPSSKTHLMAALLCVLGLWCCVCLPYCTGSCMNTNHYCGNCNKFLGSYGTDL